MQKKERKSGRRRRDGETGQSAPAIKRREREKEDCGGNCLLFLYGPLPGLVCRSFSTFPPLDWCGPLAKKSPLSSAARTCFVYSCDFFFSALPSIGQLNGGVRRGQSRLGDMGGSGSGESHDPALNKKWALFVYCMYGRGGWGKESPVSSFFFFLFTAGQSPENVRGIILYSSRRVNGIRRSGSWLTWRKSAADSCKILNITLF